MEVKGYSNYLIFRNGAVLSKGTKFNKPKFLKHSLRPNGYYVVNLRDGNGGGKPCFIHRLISEHYIPNPENKPFVDHINRIRTDNRICNLRWVTQKENNQNCNEYKLRKDSTTGHKNITLTKTGYRFQIQRDGLKHKKRFKSLDEAIKYRDDYVTKYGNILI